MARSQAPKIRHSAPERDLWTRHPEELLRNEVLVRFQLPKAIGMLVSHHNPPCVLSVHVRFHLDFIANRTLSRRTVIEVSILMKSATGSAGRISAIQRTYTKPRSRRTERLMAECYTARRNRHIGWESSMAWGKHTRTNSRPATPARPSSTTHRPTGLGNTL